MALHGGYWMFVSTREKIRVLWNASMEFKQSWTIQWKNPHMAEVHREWRERRTFKTTEAEGRRETTQRGAVQLEERSGGTWQGKGLLSCELLAIPAVASVSILINVHKTPTSPEFMHSRQGPCSPSCIQITAPCLKRTYSVHLWSDSARPSRAGQYIHFLPPS